MLGIWLNAADGSGDRHLDAKRRARSRRDSLLRLGRRFFSHRFDSRGRERWAVLAAHRSAQGDPGGCACVHGRLRSERIGLSGISEFLIGRVLQGMGAGWIVGFCYVAIEASFPERLWPRVFAGAAAAWGVASIVGPLIGGMRLRSGEPVARRVLDVRDPRSHLRGCQRSSAERERSERSQRRWLGGRWLCSRCPLRFIAAANVTHGAYASSWSLHRGGQLWRSSHGARG